MNYAQRKANFHEIDMSKLTDSVFNELISNNITLRHSGGRLYAINPTKSQLELLARRELLKGVAVVYDKRLDQYRVLPKPAAILCQLAGTCKIIKTFRRSTDALRYIKKFR